MRRIRIYKRKGVSGIDKITEDNDGTSISITNFSAADTLKDINAALIQKRKTMLSAIISKRSLASK